MKWRDAPSSLDGGATLSVVDSSSLPPTTTTSEHKPTIKSMTVQPLSVKVRAHPLWFSVALLSALCLVVINWTQRMNISGLLSIRFLRSFPTQTPEQLASQNPIHLHYPTDPSALLSRNASWPPLPVPGDVTRCIIYDRPPRTGSTTVYKYLDRCLAGRGYGSSLRTYRGVHDHNLLKHFNKENKGRKKKSLITRHLTVLPSDALLELLNSCTLLLYITSTRPMRERLLSKLKYELPDATRPGKIIAEKRRKVDADALKVAMKKRIADNVSSLFPAEQYYESFPTIWPPSKTAELALWFVPDFVIRSNRFMSDFKALLKALNCTTKFQGANVHRVENVSHDDQQLFLEAIPVSYGDARYRALANLAEYTNEQGLKKAELYF